MDVALRVVESVTMMHNGRIFKEGRPEEIESDPEVQELYLGGGPMAERPPAAAPPAPVLQVRGLNVYYGHSHALQGVDLTLDHGVLCGRRPQRHGQDHAVQDRSWAWCRRRAARSASTARS